MPGAVPGAELRAVNGAEGHPYAPGFALGWEATRASEFGHGLLAGGDLHRTVL